MNKPPRWLAIGVGNSLRGDDGVGPRLAEQIAGWKLSGVQSVALPQLVPELAAIAANAERILVIDAVTDELLVTPRWVFMNRHGTESVRRGIDSHYGDLDAMLGLRELVGGRTAKVWRIDLPARRFDFGETMSRVARRGMDLAAKQVRKALERRRIQRACMN